MSSRHVALGLLAVVLGACADPRETGTSTETENAVAVVEFPVDSLLDAGETPFAAPTVATLRLDATNFRFPRSTDSGFDLDVRTLDDRPIPFALSFWDPTARKGRIHVRIDPSLVAFAGSRLRLLSGLPAARRADPQGVWRGLPTDQALALNSVPVDDFEGGTLLRTRLPVASFWYLGGSLPASGLVDGGSTRPGTVLRLTCNAGQCGATPTLLAATLLAPSLRSLRSMDSLVLWARGPGRLRVALESLDSAQMALVQKGQLDSLDPDRTWVSLPLDTGWTRFRIRPSDFAPADGQAGNVGWTGVRDALNYITFSLQGGSELRLDDIRLHGVAPVDLR
jgi:hypothetical protein